MIEEVALHLGKDGKETKDLTDVQKKNFHKQQIKAVNSRNFETAKAKTWIENRQGIF